MPKNVEAVRDFYDKTANLKLRKAGERFSVTEERAAELLNLGFVKPTEKPKES